ncbi:MAG TPA: hypothetical protein VKA43_03340 [Gammaproteobacteria bacterium]|nr:hypothetical protein [Gammaproteobacteria bacterium]
MNTTTNNGKGARNVAKTIFRKLSVLMDEAVWQLALVGVMVVAIVDGALSIGGGSIV